MKECCVCILYIFIHSVWIRTAINADPDQNYPLCTQQTNGKCKDDFSSSFLFGQKERTAAAILLSRGAKVGPRHNRKQNKVEVHQKIGPPASVVAN
jgi:hypothetical protein